VNPQGRFEGVEMYYITADASSSGQAHGHGPRNNTCLSNIFINDIHVLACHLSAKLSSPSSARPGGTVLASKNRFNLRNGFSRRFQDRAAMA
jgi:hypothetical protein